MGGADCSFAHMDVHLDDWNEVVMDRLGKFL